MDLPREFLSYNNFNLAFDRTVRSGNKEYKRFFRHLFPSYNLALRENLNDLIDDIRHGTYRPDKPTMVYQPKKNGVLRPLTLLTLKDIIVYQAILNRVAVAFESEQQKFSFKRSFGAIFAGKSSRFFYRSWKVSYGKYNELLTAAFDAGNNYVADFDLVSFYELIDHHLLANRLARKIKNKDLIDFLLICLRSWTSDRGGASVGHGVPQGPEASAFLAECLLFHFDGQQYREVKYFRYIDDIRLMAKDEVPLRRALLRLDLQSKDLGLVPQAQKIECRRVKNSDEVLKMIPSALAAGTADDVSTRRNSSQKALLKAFRQSLIRRGNRTVIEDVTKFKFSLYRLNPRRDVLRRIAPLLSQRPDLSWLLSTYVKRFGKDVEAADTLFAALQRDPTYDSAAANYIDTMDACEPERDNTKYRRVIETANRRSEEHSITLRVSTLAFRGRRRPSAEALRLIDAERDPLVRSIVIHRLFGNHSGATFSKDLCHSLLVSQTEHENADLARFSAALLLDVWPWFNPVSWSPTKKANRSVGLLMKGIGLRKRAPKKQGVLDLFFRERFRIGMALPWRRALSKDRRETERRCLRFQQLLVGDPTARITLLDTFNELLIQNFSTRDPLLKTAYKKAAGAKPHPDLGNWLNNPSLKARLPKASSWFGQIHDARVKGELAHAKAKSTGKPTQPISYREGDKLIAGAQAAWAELIREWKTIL